MPYTELFTAAGFHVVSLTVLTGLAILHSANAGTSVSSTLLPDSWCREQAARYQAVRRACQPAGLLGIEGLPPRWNSQSPAHRWSSRPRN